MLVALRERLGRVAERLADFRQPVALRYALVLEDLQHVAELADQPLQHIGMLKLVFLQPDLRIGFELAHHLDEDLGDVIKRFLQLRLNEEHREGITLLGLERTQFRDVECPCFGDQLGPLADGQDRRRRRQAFLQFPDPVDMFKEAGERPGRGFAMAGPFAGRALERPRQIGAMTTEGKTGELPANPADHAARRLPPSERVRAITLDRLTRADARIPRAHCGQRRGVGKGWSRQNVRHREIIGGGTTAA